MYPIMEYLIAILFASNPLLAVIISLSIVFGFFWVLCKIYNRLFKRNYSSIALRALMCMFVTAGLVTALNAFLPYEATAALSSRILLGFISSLISPFVSDAIVRGIPAFLNQMEQR